MSAGSKFGAVKKASKKDSVDLKKVNGVFFHMVK